MPLYEYQCKKCGKRIEKIRKFSDPPLTVCEKCGHQGTGKEFRDPVDQMPCTCCPKCKSRDVYTTD